VATVKANKSATAIWNHFDPERVHWTGVPLRVLITNEYGLQDYQIVGVPAWAASDRWDVEAKADAPSAPAEKIQMMRTLLADRFHLTFHMETRELPEYRLEVAKGGPKLQKAEGGAPGGGVRVDKGLIEGHQTTMATLAGFLKGELGRPVFDNTGLTGSYNVRLEWLPDESQPNSGGEAPPVDAMGAPIFTALQGLGLRLTPFKGPVEIFVVDHVEKASGN
jgi:uncharacterized protein (TIGR03435 family)